LKEKVKKGGWKRTKFLLVHFLDGRQKLVRICAGVVVGSVATFLSPVTPAVCDSPNIALAVFCIVTAASRGSSFSSQPTYLPTFNNVLPHHNCHTYPLRELPSNLRTFSIWAGSNRHFNTSLYIPVLWRYLVWKVKFSCSTQELNHEKNVFARSRIRIGTVKTYF